MLKKSLLIGLLALGSAVVVPVGLLGPTVAVAQTLNPKVGDPLKKALDAANRGAYKDALAQLKLADGAGKSAFERFKINETYGFVYLKQRNYAAAAGAYERSLESGQLPAGQVNDRLKQLAQLNFQSPRNLEKVISYGNRYLKATGAKDPAMHALLGQAYQLGGNDKAAIASTVTAVRNAQAAGQRPDENWLRILLKSYGKLGDSDGVSRTTLNLVQLYPTQDNWRLLSSALRKQASGDDRVAMNVYRLMTELELMDKPELYTEAAIVAIQAGLPAEAVKIMDQGYSSKVIAADDARSQRIMNDARQKLAAQKVQVAQLTEKAKAGSGQDELRLGELLLSYGEASQALAAAQRALKKGALANVDDAYMLIGRSYLQLKKSAEARKAFNQVKGKDSAAVARLWGIYASRA